jgi:hypothetical protein
MNSFGLMWAKVDTLYPDVLHLMLQTAKYLKLLTGNLDYFLFGDALLPNVSSVSLYVWPYSE